MPANTGFGPLSIGRDIAVDVTLPDGTVLELNVITGFDKRQDTTKLNSKGLDGIHRHADIPDGWSGSINIDRGSPALENFFAALEASYYATGVLNAVRIFETIIEADQSVSQFRYDGVALQLSDGGKSGPDQYVTQTIAWRSSKRTKVQ